MGKLERRVIPCQGVPNKGGHKASHRLNKAKNSANQLNRKRIKISIEPDEYEMFWVVTFETLNLKGKAQFPYSPDINDPEIHRLAKEMIRRESRVR